MSSMKFAAWMVQTGVQGCLGRNLHKECRVNDSGGSLSGNILNLEKSLRERRGFQLVQGIDFTDGKLWDLWLDESVVRFRMRKQGDWIAREAGFSVTDVLTKPKRIYQGVREEGEAEWLCYCGIPTNAYNEHGTFKPYKGQVLLVFVDHDRIIYNWRWEKCCPSAPYSPNDHDTRFLKQVL